MVNYKQFSNFQYDTSTEAAASSSKIREIKEQRTRLGLEVGTEPELYLGLAK